jgi:hypothetical protein
MDEERKESITLRKYNLHSKIMIEEEKSDSGLKS